MPKVEKKYLYMMDDEDSSLGKILITKRFGRWTGSTNRLMELMSMLEFPIPIHYYTFLDSNGEEWEAVDMDRALVYFERRRDII